MVNLSYVETSVMYSTLDFICQSIYEFKSISICFQKLACRNEDIALIFGMRDTCCKYQL